MAFVLSEEQQMLRDSARSFADEKLPISQLRALRAKGEDIFNNVSKQAWDEWQKHQTMLINERRLNMMNVEDRKFLQGEMDKFLSGQEYALAEGYVPPSE